MQRFALAEKRKMGWLALVALAALMATPAARAQDENGQQDPPDQAGRISAANGTVSIQPAGTTDWGQAYQNLPVAPGDRIYTDQNGWAEVQVGQTYVRIGPNSDITLIGATGESISWGLAQGGVHVHSFGLWQGQTVNFSTPNGDVQNGVAGEMRLDVLPEQNATIVSSLSSGLYVSGAGGYAQQMGQGQALELSGSNPVYPMWLQPAAQDGLDQWSQQRDQQIVSAASYRYVSPGVEGAAELDANGDWTPDSDYGPMWFPRNVPAGWQPYRYGHWINRDPWGWVWVEDEPWGYAPFHYGRWVTYRGRWGWVPGPREQRPVWSPALVVFAGGIHVGGGSVSAWFPLGPGEAYRPWYRCSPRYVDRVNIANIHEGRVVHVQKTYINVVNVTNVTYINRTVGAMAMRPEDFAAGRSARQSAVQVDQRQFDRVQAVDRPAPVMRQSFVSRPAARPVPVASRQPVFINRQGMQISARPGAAPQPVPQSHMAPPARPVQGRTVIATPRQNNPNNGNMQQPGNRPNNGGQPQFGNRQPQNNGGQPQGNQPNAGANNGRPGQQPAQGQTPQGQPANNQNAHPQLPTDARPVGHPVMPTNDRGARQFQTGQPNANPNPAGNPNAGQNQTKPQASPAQPQPQRPNQQTQNPQQNQQRQNPQQQPQQGKPNPQPGQQPAQQPGAQPRPNALQPNQPQQRPNQQMPQPRPNTQNQPQQQNQPQANRPGGRPQDQARPDRKDNSNKDQKKDQKKDEKKNDK